MVLHIVTYVTHSERYFSLLKDYPGLVILGYGSKWNGPIDKIRGVIKYCNTVNPDDIVLFVQGFDSVILSSVDEILTKYSEFDNNPLIFSKGVNPDTILYKYLLDKLYSRNADGYSINTHMYIGPAKKIISFWNEYIDGNIEKYANNIFRNNPDLVTVDIDYKLFYNYSKIDSITINNNRLVINDNSPCVLSGSKFTNLKDVLIKLNIKDIPEVSIDYFSLIKCYLSNFLIEIMILVLILTIALVPLKNKLIYFIIAYTLLLEIIHYQLYVKFVNTSSFIKFIYSIMEFFHILIMVIIFILMFNFKCELKKLMILNIAMFVLIGCFFIFKRCILTILENKVLGVDERIGTVSKTTRIMYFFKLSKRYIPPNQDNDFGNTLAWMNGNGILIFFVLLLNSWCFFSSQNKLVCKSNRSHSRRNT